MRPLGKLGLHGLIGFIFSSGFCFAEDSSELLCLKKQKYLSRFAQYVIARPLTSEEFNQVCAVSLAEMIPRLLPSWAKNEMFGHSWVSYIEDSLHTSGQRNMTNGEQSEKIDYDHPGRLARYISHENRPYAEILTADYCVGEDRQPTKSCDSGAPYRVGVLSSRAFQLENASLFNLHRTYTMLEAFLCQTVPLSPDLNPPTAKEDLIPIFAKNKPESADFTFGNGTGCYSCHSHFAGFAQMFNKFDERGQWASDNGGLDEGYIFGLGRNRAYASHFRDAAKANSEATFILGSHAASVPEAAAIIASHKQFARCAANKMVKSFLGPKAQPTAIEKISDDFAKDFSASTFTYLDLVQFVFKHEEMHQAVGIAASKSLDERKE